MNAVSSGLVVVVLCLGPLLGATAQTTTAERRQFESAKAQAERGDAEAQLTLGSYYAAGTGVNRDPAKAAKWYRKAAEQGLARAQYRLAYDYANGVGVKLDRVEAIEWLRRAAEQGFADAQVELGRCYSNGNGIEKNAGAATAWYRKAADQDSPAGEYFLGTCYFEGYGLTKDIPEGLAWMRKAAEQGFPAAENSYGLCYAKGNGVQQDYLQAYKWFNLAAAQTGEHNSAARSNLAMAERALTPAQIAQGQELAREFKPRLSGPAGSGPTNNRLSSNGAAIALGAQTGYLTVTADDQTCEIYLDGAFVGNAPAKLKVDAGTHVIEIKKRGFKDFRRQLRVTGGSEQTLRAALESQ